MTHTVILSKCIFINVATVCFIYEGGPKTTGFSLKKEDLFTFRKKHLIPFKILSIGGNTLVQYFFPLCEASLELLRLDVVECLLRSCFHLLHGGKSLSFQCLFFFIAGNKKKSQGARSGEQGGWGTTVHPREAKYWVTDKAV